MKFNELKSQFHAYLLSGDPLAEQLKQEGYSVASFSSEQELIRTAQETPPHFISGALTEFDFIENIKNLSDEIKVIHTVQDAEDEAIQFLTRMELEKNKALQTLAVTQFNPKLQFQDHYFELAKTFQTQSHTDVDEWMRALVQSSSAMLDHKPAIFLKYLPLQRVLVLKRAAGLNEADLRSVGVPLSFLDPKEVEKILVEHPERLDILQEMLKSVFGLLEYSLYPITIQGKPYGVLVLFRKLRTAAHIRLLEFYLAITKDKITNLSLAKKISEIQNTDPVTDFLNLEVFGRHVTDEVSRARRLQKNLSFILIEIDHLQKYKENNGSPMTDTLLKGISQMLRKSFRVTDILGRVAENKFAILCPHSDFKGVAKKAEKLRALIESTPFPYGQKQPTGKLTVSLGLSSFPFTSESAEKLWKAAEESLEYVRRGGRNRVCISEAPRGFKPEFGADDRT